jgi:formate dehydrogenase (NADP+) beta subunit
MYDVARSALRLSGDKEVHVVCLESRAEMPADEIEVSKAPKKASACTIGAVRGK